MRFLGHILSFMRFYSTHFDKRTNNVSNS